MVVPPGSGSSTRWKVWFARAGARIPGPLLKSVWRAKTDDTIQLWDTREPDEWSGETLKKGAFRKGRVPWAEFLSWKEFRKKVNDKAAVIATQNYFEMLAVKEYGNLANTVATMGVLAGLRNKFTIAQDAGRSVRVRTLHIGRPRQGSRFGQKLRPGVVQRLALERDARVEHEACQAIFHSHGSSQTCRQALIQRLGRGRTPSSSALTTPLGGRGSTIPGPGRSIRHPAD